MEGNSRVDEIFEDAFQNGKIPKPKITTALIDSIEGTRITFQQLNAMSNRLARRLLQFTTEKSESDRHRIIGVFMHQTWRIPVVLLSILKAGYSYLPIDPFLPADRIRFLIEDSGASAVICDSTFDPKREEPKKIVKTVAWYNFEDLEIASREISGENLSTDERTERSPEKTSVFCVMYTSGSTGKPKGVCLPHSAVLNRLSWQWSRFPYESDEICCFKTSISFVDSISEIFCPLLCGISLVTVPKNIVQNPIQFLDILREHQVSRIVLVPSLLRTMLATIQLTQSETTPMPYLKLWVCSGETLSIELAETFFEVFHSSEENKFASKRLCNFYGSTEVMADVLFEVFDSLQDLQNKIFKGKLSIGKPISNALVILVDAQNIKANECITAEDEVGEICVSGPCLAAGYLSPVTKQPVGVDGKFVKNCFSNEPGFERLFKTGDLGVIWKGMFFFRGRADSMVKVRGHRVDLSEIQGALKKIPGVENVVTLCHNVGHESKQMIVSYIERPKQTGGLTLNEASVKAFIKEKLPC